VPNRLFSGRRSCVSFARHPAWCSVDGIQHPPSLPPLIFGGLHMAARKLLLYVMLLLCVVSFGCQCPLSCCPFSSSQPNYACCYPAQPSCPTCYQYPQPCQAAMPMCSSPMGCNSGWDSGCPMPCNDGCCSSSCGYGGGGCDASFGGSSCCSYGGGGGEGLQPMMGCGAEGMPYDGDSYDSPLPATPQPAPASAPPSDGGSVLTTPTT
jgi:hypothetical protein